MKWGALSAGLSAFALVFLVAVVVLIVDPIDRLALRIAFVDSRGNSWDNGPWSDYHFPATASPSDVALAFGGIGSKGRVLEIRRLWRPYYPTREPYYGAVVISLQGTELLVIHHERGDEWVVRGQ